MEGSLFLGEHISGIVEELPENFFCFGGFTLAEIDLSQGEAGERSGFFIAGEDRVELFLAGGHIAAFDVEHGEHVEGEIAFPGAGVIGADLGEGFDDLLFLFGGAAGGGLSNGHGSAEGLLALGFLVLHEPIDSIAESRHDEGNADVGGDLFTVGGDVSGSFANRFYKRVVLDDIVK